jgi:hypothetical protein
MTLSVAVVLGPVFKVVPLWVMPIMTKLYFRRNLEGLKTGPRMTR